ncbi:Phenylalanine--tRNA ligase alpha subunit [Candidatus Annandia adelgestsuga]|uniref:Phenylalanine--tRNA ligase alpha subunit n=1 Tax=Candidatus Annandia adelgestsuga TaxID=1302411 RepID=A0A3Q9CM42_9ENTR|nr:phenylalanine--tRNA ligase subunit alpha [Candidatus Annandia adelgestsuga]AZP36397.1 Phenylalanine--tRNA ligase alpha subunit [Candidatus Annandia adelgestsuga]
MELNFIKLLKKAKHSINKSNNLQSLEKNRIKYLGKNSYLSNKIIHLNKISKKEKSILGYNINIVKNKIKNLILENKKKIEKKKLYKKLLLEKIDISLPGRKFKIGNIHPINKTISRIELFFKNLGFEVKTGPEIENTFYNFDCLNIPKYHPARKFSDTFWFNKNTLLRTQTSSVQIRVLENNKPPIKCISYGKVYRKDYDSTHTPMFHQMEGFVIDKKISFSNLKYILYNFIKFFFNDKNLKIRFRPSYFPFTEPSAEIDIKQKNGNWLEILGCGMIHPNILKYCKINYNIYSGFAFGLGIERITMLYYNIDDIRLFFENDLNFLTQF